MDRDDRFVWGVFGCGVIFYIVVILLLIAAVAVAARWVIH